MLLCAPPLKHEKMTLRLKDGHRWDREQENRPIQSLKSDDC